MFESDASDFAGLLLDAGVIFPGERDITDRASGLRDIEIPDFPTEALDSACDSDETFRWYETTLKAIPVLVEEEVARPVADLLDYIRAVILKDQGDD